ncbi:MAG: DUF2244 domain-containing protein [Cellvibrionaceae bacterium]
MVTTSVRNNTTIIILSPNRSADWSEVKKWIVLISLPALIVALGWFFVGVWIILPFAGLELALMSYLMYRVCYQNYREQHIVINQNDVTFSSGIGKPDKEYTFTLPDCYLSVTQPRKPIDKLELALKSESYTLKFGEFLNPEDRESARKSIRNAGIIECASRWWDDK